MKMYANPYYQPSMNIGAGASNAGNSSITWVQGEQAAKSYLVAPNITFPLFDSEKQTIYLKSADMYGKPSMQILDYKIRDVQPPNQIPLEPSTSDYATKDDILKLQQQIDALMRKDGTVNGKQALSNDAKSESKSNDDA